MRMQVLVRDATEADLPAILDIINEATLNTTAVWGIAPTTLEARRAWWQERTAAGFPVLVADDGGQVLGFASYGTFRPWEGYNHTVEHSVYVDASARGKGVGRVLLTALIAHATESGRHVMIAGIDASNSVSVRLHEALGFTACGTLTQVGRKFDRWLDLLFMQRLLSTGDAA
jgi:phosphinothricin acetyltransferase